MEYSEEGVCVSTACILDPFFISIFNFMLYGMLKRGNLSFMRRTDCTLAARDVTLSFR